MQRIFGFLAVLVVAGAWVPAQAAAPLQVMEIVVTGLGALQERWCCASSTCV